MNQTLTLFRNAARRARLFLMAFISLAAAGIAVALLPARPVIMLWDYPTNGVNIELSFVLHSHTNLSVHPTNWPAFVSYPITQWYSNGVCIAPIEGTNHVFRVTNIVAPAQMWFYVTASNFWGESDPSNTLGFPPAPAQGSDLKAQRGW